MKEKPQFRFETVMEEGKIEAKSLLEYLLGILGPIPEPMVVFEVIPHLVEVHTHKQNV